MFQRRTSESGCYIVTRLVMFRSDKHEKEAKEDEKNSNGADERNDLRRLFRGAGHRIARDFNANTAQ